MTVHPAAADGVNGGAAFFDTQAARWVGLYDSKACFRDRLDLFTSAVAAVRTCPGFRLRPRRDRARAGGAGL